MRPATLSALADLLDPPRVAGPVEMMSSVGMEPDTWQLEVLTSDARRMLLLCSRQAGKSTVTAALAMGVALDQPGSLILLVSPSQRQSGELFRKVLGFLRAQPGVKLANETALTITLVGGSRIVALPGAEGTVRGFSGVRLLVIDEAARVDDDLYRATSPMLAVSGGRLVALSTPWGRRGWFHAAWHSGEDWKRIKVTAHECPRIPKDFLASERASLGEWWYHQEYECSFEDTDTAFFTRAEVEAALSDEVEPLFAARSGS
jgi:hypothetical protein